jgi:lactate racemase
MMATTTDTTRINLPYGDQVVPIDIPSRHLRSVLSPNIVAAVSSLDDEIRRALNEPIGAPRLREKATGARNAVIIADDLTRLTPVDRVIPHVLEELNAAGMSDDQITVLIALGTHRPMTEPEIDQRFGNEVMRRVQVLNSPWTDPEQMQDLGTTEQGTPISIARLAIETDIVIGLGSIVPHHIPGFSAGAKIVQPGISGAATTGATHFLSTRTRRSYLGSVENVIRHEMEAIAERVGLTAVLNTVLNQDGDVVGAVYGDQRQAFRSGVSLSSNVYGVRCQQQADIVIASSYPCDIEFWQAHKSLYPADIAVREGGTIIVLTPCPEGVSVTHQDMLEITALRAEQIELMIDRGELDDVVSGGLALAWARIRERADVSLVSGGISDTDARALAFTPYQSVEDALTAALHKYGEDATINVLTHAPDLLPILEH